MSRTLSAAALGLFAAAAVALSGPAPAVRAAEPGKPLVPTIKEIMREAHSCRTAYIGDVRRELSKPEPDWTVIESRSRDLVRVGKLLALNTPPAGTSESWEKLTTLYVARATVLAEAAGRRDTDEAKLVGQRLGTMCAGCHRAHRR